MTERVAYSPGYGVSDICMLCDLMLLNSTPYTANTIVRRCFDFDLVNGTYKQTKIKRVPFQYKIYWMNYLYGLPFTN